MRIAVRNWSAKLLRSLPQFKGKRRIGKFLQKALTIPENVEEHFETFQMKDGSLMRVDLRSYTEHPSFWTGIFDPEVSLLTSYLKPGSVVLDVGANIGFYSIPLGRRLLQEGGALYAIEPVPTNFARLKENIALNGLEHVITPINVALGDHQGVVELSMGEEHDTAETGNAVVVGGKVLRKVTASARMTTLDNLVEENDIARCDVIKVDIEGGEFAFLKGGMRFIRTNGPLIYLELNYHWMEQREWSLRDLHELARELGYTVLRKDRRGRFEGGATNGTGIENAFLVPMSRGLDDYSRN